MKRYLAAACAVLLLLLPFQLGAAVLTVTDVTEAGTLETLTAAASGGDSFANDSSGRVFFVVSNGGAGTLTVTITPAVTQVFIPGQGTMTKAAGGGTIGAGLRRIYGPFPTLYNDSNGRVSITYSTNTSVTVNPFRLPSP